MAAREGYTELQARVLAARRVWKRTLFWTGCAIGIVGLIAILAGAAIVDLLMPLPGSVRIALLLAIIGAVGYLLYKHLIQPLRAKLTPHDVALNVERQHQDLEDRLVSALQFGEEETEDPIKSHLLQRLVTDAVERTEEIDFKATIDKRVKRKHIGIAFAALAGCALIALIFPTELNTSLNRLLNPWEKTEPVFTTKLTVEPGNARILRGRSLAINLEVTGKAADKARLVYTKGDLAADTTPLPPASGGIQGVRQEIDMMQIEGEKRKFGYEIFNINENLEYYVTANATESERYAVEVFDMPKLTAIEISYTYPEYTKLKPIIQQGEGNIRAVAGSQAEVRITTNKAIESATLTVDAGDPTPMVIFDGRTLTTTLDVLNDGKYTVKLLCVDGFNNQVPIKYTITAIPDEPPEIVIKEPGRDIKATKLEEVRVQAEATDDYGVENMTLMYSIGSGEAQELPIESVEVKAEKIISGAYVFYLEELDVEPGELISYYAQATDNNTRTGPGTSTSELYFIEVRPFNERYMQMDAEGQQALAPEGQPFPNLIADQRAIIKNTWKHIHSRPSPVTEDYQAAVKKIGKAQDQLKDKTQRTVDELSMSMRDANVDPEMLMSLEQAVGKMGEASDELFAIKPKAALPHEQDALELLTKAMMELDKVLTQMRSGGSQAAADNIEMDMEDLQDAIEQDENELDEQMAEQTQELLDQARDMLGQQEQLTEQSQQLAREQQPSQREMQQNSQQEGQLAGQAQQMAEQAQQMGQSSGQGSGQSNTGQGQRMVQAGDALQEASENMQAASKNMGAGQAQMGAAKGQKAEENLQQAIEELEKVAAQYTDQALEEATEAIDRLITRQSEVREQTETLEEETRQDGVGLEDLRNASQLANEQRTLRRDLEQLQRSLSNLREALSENEPQAARNVADANRRLIEEQVSGNMEDAQRALQWRNFQSSEREQREVLDTLLEARDDLQQARTNLAETEEERLDAALEQIESWAAQMEDIQRELEGMDNQETPLTPEQEARQQQLSEQQEQIQERAQEAMEAQDQGDEQAQVGGAESDREIRELWLDAIRAMDNRPGTRRAPFPVYDFSLRELRKLERAIEERLTTIQEKKQLAQVLKEDVPPEYRKMVDQYYEFLAK